VFLRRPATDFRPNPLTEIASREAQQAAEKNLPLVRARLPALRGRLELPRSLNTHHDGSHASPRGSVATTTTPWRSS
jgi:hypothetical protein